MVQQHQFPARTLSGGLAAICCRENPSPTMNNPDNIRAKEADRYVHVLIPAALKKSGQ